ncbi:MAG: hypothetical protein ACOZB3_11605 [Calditrichota bacterium]
MIRPIENHERLHPSEYLNRVRQTDPTGSASTRDFSYEIEEVVREEKHPKQQEQELGEDIYEPSEEEQTPHDSEQKQQPKRPGPPSPDEGQLDIVV